MPSTHIVAHRYSCVALAGVVTEYLRFGQAEGGLGDVQQLDSMFKALNVGDALGIPNLCLGCHGQRATAVLIGFSSERDDVRLRPH